jgi:hypothetical protein
MSWIPSGFKSSIRALLSNSADEEPCSDIREEDIRRAMLNTLDHKDWSSYSYLEYRILFAEDLIALWYLRSELMHIISTCHGELLASGKMREISTMFKGLLPKNMNSRPSPLGKD